MDTLRSREQVGLHRGAIAKGTHPAVFEADEVLDAEVANEHAGKVPCLEDLEQGPVNRFYDGFVAGEREHERVQLPLLPLERLLVLRFGE